MTGSSNGLTGASEPRESCRHEEDPNRLEERLKEVGERQLVDSYQRLRLIYDLGQQICATVDPQKLSQVVLDAIVRLIPVERSFLALLDAEGRLRPLAVHNFPNADRADNFPVSQTVLRRVLEKSVSVLTNDATSEPSLANVPSVASLQLRSVMAVPLGTGANCLGLIYADNRNESAMFSEVDQLFLMALARYVELAIRNAQELDAAKRHRRLSEERCDLLQRSLFKDFNIHSSRHRVPCRGGWVS